MTAHIGASPGTILKELKIPCPNRFPEMKRGRKLRDFSIAVIVVPWHGKTGPLTHGKRKSPEAMA